MSNHGATMPLTDDAPAGVQCDWGDCDKPATKLRFDAHGHGWLPCCDDCADKPVNE